MAEKKRRGHNEGSVYFDASRNRWVAAISISPGKRKKFYFEKKQDAVKKKNEALRELEQGTLATGTQRKLGEYLVDWLENVHKSKVRVGTYVNYKKKIKYIVDGLGNVWLQKLTPEQVQDFLQKQLANGLSSKTVHEIHGVLRLALKNALRWGLVSRNVCEVVDPPTIVSREAVPLSVEQARILVKHVRGHRLEVLLAMAVVTGMRRGELLALRWSDIDFERCRLLVSHSVDYIAGYGYVVGKPKTAAGKRWVSLPAFLFKMLKQHQFQQLEMKRLTKEWKDNDLVFPNRHGGYLHPNHMGEQFRKLLKEAGLPAIHFHDLRHSAATILLCMGVNVKVIQELLGHSDISVTLGVYGHLLPSMQQAVVDTWEDVFGNTDNDSEKQG
ncbi:integrase [Thermosporothrix hazakensis]|jgi:integrase|uniref:Integrase n=1 Tax=Thermosporothrix hazakensis TaxID=644383 RepID=A0A326U0I5_THEHA|nr:tyrosine-type recombinase/integrase [Thermosporothrix hazakensis]PZW23906.1 integrase [Thermosporothrix hazakensis]GCE48496.1 site-specific integrase [Thermosporothrix hazakensis]